MLMLKDLLHEEWLRKTRQRHLLFFGGERREMSSGQNPGLFIEGLWDSFKLKTSQSIVFIPESYVQK